MQGNNVPLQIFADVLGEPLAVLQAQFAAILHGGGVNCATMGALPALPAMAAADLPPCALQRVGATTPPPGRLDYTCVRSLRTARLHLPVGPPRDLPRGFLLNCSSTPPKGNPLADTLAHLPKEVH